MQWHEKDNELDPVTQAIRSVGIWFDPFQGCYELSLGR